MIKAESIGEAPKPVIECPKLMVVHGKKTIVLAIKSIINIVEVIVLRSTLFPIGQIRSFDKEELTDYTGELLLTNIEG